jgi:hypothetical protein
MGTTNPRVDPCEKPKSARHPNPAGHAAGPLVARNTSPWDADGPRISDPGASGVLY